MSSAYPPARKSLGQNFLHDPNVIARIVASITPAPDDVMIEIGPGRGALTVPLLQALKTLHVVEYDRELAARLPALPGGDRLEIHQGDAVAFDFDRVPGRLRVVGNLPYQISSPLLFRLAEYAPRIDDMVFMLQKEVVERMTASPGSGIYGRLTVMLATSFKSERLFDVGPGAFKPAPKVHSSIVRLVPHGDGPMNVGDTERFAELVRRGFAARRKTVRNALKGLVDASGFAACDIDPGCRPETLSPEQWASLSRKLG